MDRVIFASYGNDSVALIQWCHENGIKDAAVVYSDTGWAKREWMLERVIPGEEWVRSLGYTPHRTQSIGMVNLVQQRKAWPRGGGGKYQFCTQVLKKDPALAWLAENDPEGDAICMVGVRREESPNRANWPEWTEESEAHGGRMLHSPLVRHTEVLRNELIVKTPFPILAYRSKECYPCVNARKHEIASLPENRRELIHMVEVYMGVNSNGNPRVMFSPKRHKGATGIHEVFNWATNGANKEEPLTPDCDSGYCGS